MGNVLRDWLKEALNQKDWSHNELARRAGLSQAMVSNVLAANRKPGADFCVKVARALNEPPEKLFRLAGFLPSLSPDDDEVLQDLLDLARNLTEHDRNELLIYARFRYQQHLDNTKS